MTDLDTQLIHTARECAGRARPVVSGFAVGAALLTDRGDVVGGTNYEDHDTIAGICAERAALHAANAALGRVASDGGPGLTIVKVAVWAPRTLCWPCGICRVALAAAGGPEVEVIAAHEAGEARLTLAELYPLAGRGPDRDVKGELRTWRGAGPAARRGVEDYPGGDALIDAAIAAAAWSYLPPLRGGAPCDHPTGAAIELANGALVTGALQVDATTRLGGGALTSAVRRVLGPIAERPRVRRVAYYTDGAPLRAPDGVELQILQEVTPVGDDVEIVSINKDRQMFTASLARLFPHPFGPKDLGY